jgi:hypothetical protein
VRANKERYSALKTPVLARHARRIATLRVVLRRAAKKNLGVTFFFD